MEPRNLYAVRLLPDCFKNRLFYRGHDPIIDGHSGLGNNNNRIIELHRNRSWHGQFLPSKGLYRALGNESSGGNGR